MKDVKKKLSLVFVPLVAGLIATIIGYTALNWLLVLHLKWIDVKDIFIEFLGPAVCSFLVVYFALRPYIRLLRLKPRQEDYFGLYVLIAAVLFVPTVITQKYLATATGKLTHLTDINQYPAVPKTKYYTLDTFHLFTEKASFSYRRSTTGRHGSRLLFEMYCVIPVLKTAKEIVKDSCWYYLCTKYTDEISADKNEERVRSAYRHFLKRSEMDFRSTNFNNFTYLEVLGKTNDSEEYKEAVFYSPLIGGDNPALLVPRHTPFENRSDGTFGWIFKSIGIALIVLLVIILSYGYKPEAIYTGKGKCR